MQSAVGVPDGVLGLLKILRRRLWNCEFHVIRT
jgi:hypothetical protein